MVRVFIISKPGQVCQMDTMSYYKILGCRNVMYFGHFYQARNTWYFLCSCRTRKSPPVPSQSDGLAAVT